MKQKTFVIRDTHVISNLVSFLESQPEKPVLEVVVRDHQKDRNVIQNSKYWLWITVIAGELGMTKQDTHSDLKRRILVPIYERDDQGYCAMINALRKLHTQGFKEDSVFLHNHIVKLTSTTNATVKQFAEYLREIERDMMGKGIVLPHKEDLQYDQILGKH